MVTTEAHQPQVEQNLRLIYVPYKSYIKDVIKLIRRSCIFPDYLSDYVRLYKDLNEAVDMLKLLMRDPILVLSPNILCLIDLHDDNDRNRVKSVIDTYIISHC